MKNRSLFLWASLVVLPLLQACGAQESTSESEAMPVQAGSTVSGRVLTCHDGDTCNIMLTGQNRRFTVRLAGIDAPEVSGGESGGQPLGKDSRGLLNGLVKGKDVKVRTVELDPYGRMVGEIYVGTKLVNMLIVEKGMAEAYRWADNRVNKKAYRDAEKRAKLARAGVWSLSQYESPGEFRRRTKASSSN